MKRAIVAGLFAGVVAGIVAVIFKISGLYNLFSVTPYVKLPFDVQIIIETEIVWAIVWGVIWIAFYSIFYDVIPGIGIKKGLIYSLILWMIVSIRPAILAFVYGFGQWTIPEIITGFFSICITYGVLIGILYKKE